MDLHSELFVMLEKPNVQAMQLVSVYAHAKSCGISVRRLPRYVCCADEKGVAVLHSAPKNEALRVIASGRAQLCVRFLNNERRHQESCNGLKGVHCGGGP